MSRVCNNKSSYRKKLQPYKTKIEKIRKMQICKTIAQMRFNRQHNIQHNTCKKLRNEQT